MKHVLGWTALFAMTCTATAARAESLSLVYPPDGHTTTAERIFFIGTAPPGETVSVNGVAIDRSPSGHFAPSFPLSVGENRFVLRYGEQTLVVNVERESLLPPVVEGLVPDSLQPQQDIARLLGERVCLSAIAPENSSVTAVLAGETIPLYPEAARAVLPGNGAALIGDNEPLGMETQRYSGCFYPMGAGDLGTPQFRLAAPGGAIAMPGTGSIRILAPERLTVVEVIAEAGVARTGPGTDYSRLTPLPRGTRGVVTGSEGEWLRLDYGGWIKRQETRDLAAAAPPRAIVRSILSRPLEGATEVVFPLTVPVPVSVRQAGDTFILTLHNTVAQTDTIRLEPDIQRFDWQQIAPETVEYRLQLPWQQQWGYDLRYEGSSLILSLPQPPLFRDRSSLAGARILLDPGHGGEELGARGPDGTPEKEINLVVSRLLRRELQQRGATVVITRDRDRFVSLAERQEAIANLKPDLALSIHYNALPDGGDAEGTAGIGMFWYHPQAQDLATFLHDYLVEELDRPSYGVFWNNLALTRPHSAPSVLLELGFIINPTEFEWISDPEAQQQLAETLADGITVWMLDKAE